MSISTVEGLAESQPSTVAGKATVEVSASRTISTAIRCAHPMGRDETTGRVNRCGAEAWVEVKYTADGEVNRFLCRHHGNEIWATLVDTAISIKDERHLVNTKPGGSAAG